MKCLKNTVCSSLTVTLAHDVNTQPNTSSTLPYPVTPSQGVLPHQLCDLQALMGDSADNVPGVKVYML